MDFQKSVSWAAIAGVIALVAISLTVGDPSLRAILSLAAISPLLDIALKVSRIFERHAAQQKRRYVRLREITDEFIMHVRNLNRITVAGKIENAPENVGTMIDEIVERMHKLVERMREAAGKPLEEPGEVERSD